MMNLLLAFSIVLSGHSASFSMVFSPGTQLLVDDRIKLTDYDEEDYFLPPGNTTAGSSDRPSINILRPIRISQDPESPQVLVCLLEGLKSPQEQVLWWIDDTPVTSAGATGPWTRSKRGYSATLVWEVSAADWRPTSSLWCGSIRDGQEYRKKLCSEE